jgi:uncharacterized protein YuzE
MKKKRVKTIVQNCKHWKGVWTSRPLVIKIYPGDDYDFVATIEQIGGLGCGNTQKEALNELRELVFVEAEGYLKLAREECMDGVQAFAPYKDEDLVRRGVVKILDCGYVTEEIQKINDKIVATYLRFGRPRRSVEQLVSKDGNTILDIDKNGQLAGIERLNVDCLALLIAHSIMCNP